MILVSHANSTIHIITYDAPLSCPDTVYLLSKKIWKMLQNNPL